MTVHWCDETRADVDRWSDARLVREGLDVFEELARATDDGVLLSRQHKSCGIGRLKRRDGGQRAKGKGVLQSGGLVRHLEASKEPGR